jgi:serine/threonine protein kinase
MVAALEPGTLIDGRYRLERQLGAGGMGVVWAARQVMTRQPVALKFLRDPERSPHARRRFLREARAACAVRHPNVVQIHDVLVVDDETPVIVMEMLEGESFGAMLKREKRLEVEAFARLMLPVVSAVGTAHALGIVHRDLKPDNIFLAKDASGALVKVLDFGLAKLTATEGDAEKTAGLTDTGIVVGTPYYMSPEQAFGERDVDHRTDIWALGIIFYQALSSSLPTRAENAGQVLKLILGDGIVPLSILVPDLPDDLLALIAQMLQRERGRRPEDLRAVQAVLARHTDVPIASFGSAIAPALGSGRLADSSDEYAAAAALAATPPSKPLQIAVPFTARASSSQTDPSDAPTRSAPSARRVSLEAAAPEDPLASTSAASPAALLESAAASVKSVSEREARTARRRSIGRLAWVAAAIAGAGAFGWTVAVRTTGHGEAVAQGSSSTGAGIATTAPSADAPQRPAPPATVSAPVGTVPSSTPETAASSSVARPPRSAPPATPRPKPASAPPPAASTAPKPGAPDIFIDKPPF